MENTIQSLDNARASQPGTSPLRSKSPARRSIERSSLERSPLDTLPRRDMGFSQPSRVAGLSELLAQVESLQAERDMFAQKAAAERRRNGELVSEFHNLRGLIAASQKPPGAQENLVLRG